MNLDYNQLNSLRTFLVKMTTIEYFHYKEPKINDLRIKKNQKMKTNLIKFYMAAFYFCSAYIMFA